MGCLLCHASMLSTETIPNKISYHIGISNCNSHIIAPCHTNAPCWQSAMRSCSNFIQFRSLHFIITGQTTKGQSEKTPVNPTTSSLRRFLSILSSFIQAFWDVSWPFCAHYPTNATGINFWYRLDLTAVKSFKKQNTTETRPFIACVVLKQNRCCFLCLLGTIKRCQ